MTKFFKDLFWDDNADKWSFSRVACSFLIVFMLTWVTFVVFRNGKLPDQIGGAGVFLSSSLGTLYSANKIAAAFTNPSTSPPCSEGAKDKQ